MKMTLFDKNSEVRGVFRKLLKIHHRDPEKGGLKKFLRMASSQDFSQKVSILRSLDCQTLEVYVPTGPGKSPSRLIEKGTGPWVNHLRTRLLGGSPGGHTASPPTPLYRVLGVANGLHATSWRCTDLR